MTTDKAQGSLKIHHLKFKRVMRYDRRNHICRIFRIMWQRGRVGDGHGYSSELTLALIPKWFWWLGVDSGWALIFCGVRIHYSQAYGGIHV